MRNKRVTRILRSERKLEDRYVLSAGLIVACIAMFATAGTSALGGLVTVALEGVTLVVILRASQVQARTVGIAGAATVAALLLVTVSWAVNGRVADAAPGILGAALALVAPVAIVRRLLKQPEIEFATVAGAMCVYLLAGLFFALLYWSMGELGHGSFFAQQTGASGADYVYYSFVTLTTLGYGDLTARYDVGRMFSILEALFGQVYLVSIVALLVSNIGHARRTT